MTARTHSKVQMIRIREFGVRLIQLGFRGVMSKTDSALYTESVEWSIIIYLLMRHLNCGLGNEADMYVVAYEYSDCLSKPLKLVGIIISRDT